MKKTRKLHTFRRYLVVCLSISIIPILMLGSIFIISHERSERNAILQSASQRAEMAASGFEWMMSNITSVAGHFSSEYASGESTIEEEVRRQFRTYEDTFALKGELFFYQRGEQNVYTTDGVMPYTEFEATSRFGSQLDPISFYTRLNTSYSSLCLSTQSSTNGPGFLISMHPIPVLSSSPKGVLFYVLDHESVREMLTEYLGSFEGCFAVFDSSKRLSYFWDAGGSEYGAVIASRMQAMKGSGFMETDIANKRYAVFRMPSDNTGFTYVLSMPEQVLLEDLHHELITYSLVLLLLALLGILVSVIVAHWESKPVLSLAQSVNLDSERESGNLFDAINVRVRAIVNENEQLILQASTKTNEARVHLLADLISGRIHTNDELERAVQASALSIPHPAFFVITIAFSGENAQQQAQEACNSFGQVNFRGGCAYAFDAGSPDRFGLLVNTEEDADPDTLRRQAAEHFLERLEKMHFVPTACGVSRVRHSALHANQQMFEAAAAMEQQQERVNLFRKGISSGQLLPFQEYEMFRQSLLYGNEGAAIKACQSILHLAAESSWPHDRMQAACFHLVNTLLNACDMNQIVVDSAELTLSASQADPGQLEHFMIDAIHKLTIGMKQQKEQHEQSLNSRLIDYVYQHFRELDVSTEKLADVFRISENSVRRIIREVTGQTFLNYVTELRFGYVKQMLAETDVPIKTIVENAGYIDVSNFTRKFKTAEGITPGQYRKTMQGLSYTDMCEGRPDDEN